MSGKYSQITIDGKTHRFRKEDAELVRLVRKGRDLDDQIKALKAQQNELNVRLVNLAKGRKGKDSVVQLDGVDCYASVSFGTTVSFKAEKMRGLAEGRQEQFDQLFDTRVEYKPRKALETFLSSEPTGSDRELKAGIVRAMQIKTKKPGVRYYEKKSE